MQFLFLYQLGESPERRDVKDFPDVDAAKAHACESLKDTLKSSSAERASLCIGELKGAAEDKVHWLGAYDIGRGDEPVWRVD